MLKCEKCGKLLQVDKHCYQVRWGYWVAAGVEDTKEFIPEEDVTYLCEECGIERSNV